MTDGHPAILLDPLLPSRPGDRVRWGGLHGSSLGLAIAESALRHRGPVVVIGPDVATAHRLEQELRFYLGEGQAHRLHPFADRETLPYDLFSPHQDIVSERLQTLYHLPSLDDGLLITAAPTAMHRLPPREHLEAHALLVSRGQRLRLESLRERLQSAGYRCVGQVMEHGEFAVRGGLLDLFPMGSQVPYRIELFDDEVESIRTFDPESQRSVDRVDQIRLLPAREFPLDADGIARFRQSWRRAFDGDPQASPLYRDVSQGLSPSGVEYYLPLFFERTDTLFDYLPSTAMCVVLEGTEQAAEHFWQDTKERFEQRRHDRQRPVLAPAALFLQSHELFSGLGRWPTILAQAAAVRSRQGVRSFPTAVPPALRVNVRSHRPLGAMQDFLQEFPGRVLVAVDSIGRREVLLDLFGRHDIEPQPVDDWRTFSRYEVPLAITVAAVDQGLLLEHPAVAVVTEEQLFGDRAAQPRSRERAARDPEMLVRDLAELAPGALVVHEDHGVGRYLGLQTLKVDGVEAEFLLLEYADGDKLYVPVASLHFIRRYTGPGTEHAPLHKLGSGQWERARRKAAERARDVAAELLEVYARRMARPGHRYKVDTEAYEAFAAAFPFEETPDQQDAIASVLADLQADTPTDRLVCGDVGFGKTEVALRAAFVAVQDSKQVAVLVPTTLLAQQHYQTFLDRFADWPVKVEILSRFRSRKQQQEVLAGLAQGKVDIVIGTHRLLSPDVRFKRLGLVVADEEHRFGVRDKERLKALRAEVDMLTLTATPIPRTLNMALSGLRQISVIATPPARRLAIKTFVREWDPSLVREAVMRELVRGGQVYVLHNEVETIERAARGLRDLIPEVRLEIAHGQMRERELERVMVDFYHQRFNVLVCTTIIESGIDVPTANTMIIQRADRFGLSQLHQLRGRVGRSHHQAYAYLMVPSREALTADAVKRLEAIESLEELGSGFLLATHDLEIRGAGELLGEEQSGHIQNVGFSLYMEYLERAVAALKSGREPELETALRTEADIDLHIPALLPEDYLPDVQLRLSLYKRLASTTTPDALRDLHVEIIDRFGLLPAPAKNLLRVADLRLKARALGIRKIDVGPQGGRVVFAAQPNVDPMAVIRLIQGQPKTYRLEGQEALRLISTLPDAESRFRAVQTMLERLAASPEALRKQVSVN
jgi:transcription-repair coupling factor (superfamily II helicase)